MKITLNNCSSELINNKILNSLLSEVLKQEAANESLYVIESFRKIITSKEQFKQFLYNAEVIVHYMNSDQIKVINQLYRSKSIATDVISFPERNHAEPGPDDYYKLPFSMGEIFICPDIIKKYLQEDSKEIPNENLWPQKLLDAEILTLLHGFLHLLGYDHENSMQEQEEMFSRQRNYTNLFIDQLN